MPRYRRKRLTRPRKAVYRRRGRRIPRALRMGFISAHRKLPECAIVSTAAAGSASFVGPVGFDFMTVGTPIASVGTVAGYFDVPFVIRARFNHITSPGEFAALFDTYRIKGVKVQLQNNYNIVGAASTVGGQIGYMPYIEYVYDEDDDALISPTFLREKMGLRTKYFNATANKLTINLRNPKPVLDTGLSGGATAPVTIPKGYSWINMVNTSVPHFGVKGVIRRMYLPAGTFTSSINVDATMYFDCKDVQ